MDFSRYKEHNDVQFLQSRISMAKLEPLLNQCFMKCIFGLTFYDFCMHNYAGLSQVESHFIIHGKGESTLSEVNDARM